MSPVFRIYNDLDEVPLDQPSWDTLVDRADAGGVFQQYFWIRAWWKYYKKSNELFFVTVEESNEVVAFAPMMIDRKQTLRFIGDTNADYLGFVIPREHEYLLAHLLEFLGNVNRQWRVMHLRNMRRRTIEQCDLVKLCRAKHLHPWSNYSVIAPYLRLSENDAQVTAILEKYSFRRSERLLRSLGNVTFEIFRTDEQAAQYWDTFAQQHISRCQRDGRHSSFSDPHYVQFLRELYETDPSKGRVHFSGLFLEQRPVAFHLGFVSQNTFLWYKPSFDISLSKGSPGVELIRNLIAYAHQQELSEFDFTIGDEAFKKRFADQFRTVQEYRIHFSPLRYLADTGYWRIRRLAKRLTGGG